MHHLKRIGFDGSPRVCGWDQEGREILTWIDGEAPALPWPPWMQTDEALDALGRLLRRYHDAVGNFTPPPEAKGTRGGRFSVRHEYPVAGPGHAVRQ